MLKSVLVPVISVLLMIAGAALGQADEKIGQALESMRLGDYNEALKLLDSLKQEDSTNAQAYYYSGLILYRTNQQERGLEELEKALTLAPREVQFLLTYAELLLKTGNHFKALEVMEPGILRFEPTDLTAEQNWFCSDLLFRLGKTQEALPFLEAYASVRPEDDRVYFRRAQSYLVLNNLDRSLECFEEAYQKTDRKAAARYGTGLVNYQKGDLGAARKALEEAVDGEPENLEYVHLLAQSLLSLGEPEEALRHLTRVEIQGSDFPKIYDALARVHRQLGEVEKANEYARKFRELDLKQREVSDQEQRVHSLLRDAQRLYNEGRRQAARKGFEQVLEIDSNSYLAHSYLVEIYLGQDGWDSALYHLDRLREIRPGAFETHYLRAVYHYRKGELERAIAFAEEAKQVQPSIADLRNLLGNIYYQLANYPAAVEEYAAAMKLEPDRSEFRLNYETVKSKMIVPE